jgi:hypothetical protein
MPAVLNDLQSSNTFSLMKNLLSVLIVLALFACKNDKSEKPIDTRATQETVNLYRNLKKIMDRGFMVGHQDDLAYGVNWKYESGRSDVKDVTGDYPAVYGWELGHLEVGADTNLDGVPFNKMKTFIQQGYQRGGVITISWHGTNPMTGESAWAPKEGTVKSILPGGEKNEYFNEQLDRIADFMLSLRGKNNELIPILFRPFHEHTGGWFWWGTTTPDEEYKALFRYTADYLKNTRKVHNLLYVYNTGTEFSNAAEFLERYPGDDVIDMVSFDTYQRGDAATDSSYTIGLDLRMGIIEQVAAEKNKLPLLGETGYGQIPFPEWWTKRLMPGLENHKFLYVLFWRNAGYKARENEIEYYVPYDGQPSAPDFKKFYELPQTLFQKDITYDELYGDNDSD